MAIQCQYYLDAHLGRIITCIYVKEHPKTQPGVVLVLKRLRRRAEWLNK